MELMLALAKDNSTRAAGLVLAIFGFFFGIALPEGMALWGAMLFFGVVLICRVEGGIADQGFMPLVRQGLHAFFVFPALIVMGAFVVLLGLRFEVSFSIEDLRDMAVLLFTMGAVFSSLFWIKVVLQDLVSGALEARSESWACGVQPSWVVHGLMLVMIIGLSVASAWGLL